MPIRAAGINSEEEAKGRSELHICHIICATGFFLTLYVQPVSFQAGFSIIEAAFLDGGIKLAAAITV